MSSVIRFETGRPGKTMILRTKEFFKEGAYADIFKSEDGTRVYKLFISTKHPTNVTQGITNPKDEEYRRKTYQSECEAYEHAGRDPYLSRHVPGGFERYVVEDVTDSTGSVSNRYMLDCCYGMEYIEGEEKKLWTFLPEEYPDHIKKALKAFREAGIHYLEDVSVFLSYDADNFVIIDFAKEKYLVFR